MIDDSIDDLRNLELDNESGLIIEKHSARVKGIFWFLYFLVRKWKKT